MDYWKILETEKSVQSEDNVINTNIIFVNIPILHSVISSSVKNTQMSGMML